MRTQFYHSFCYYGHFLCLFQKLQLHFTIRHSKKAKPTARKKLHYWSGDDGKFEWASDYVYGIDADYRLVKSSKVSSFLNGDGEANIIRANGLDHFKKSKEYKGKLKEFSATDNKDNGQFDVLIANPPYSVSSFKSTVKYGEESFELFERLTDNSSEIECLFVERMKQLLKVGGYAGIILPSSILSNTGIYTATREILLKYFKIIAITEFGSNTFMATGTNTVTLFLERRPNTDYKNIQNAINSFFERPKDVAVLGIEKAFSKYVKYVSGGVSFEDYASFVCQKTTANFAELEIYQDYRSWFDNLTDIKNLKAKKTFKELTAKEQGKELDKLFYEKVFAIEKDKMLYFMLTWDQKTVITKVGEKQAEKEFIGYEFSNRRGHEGIKMLSNGTKLYDDTGIFNTKKANSYIYNAFNGSYTGIDESLKHNVSYVDAFGLIDFTGVQFEKLISLNSKKKLIFASCKYQIKKLGEVAQITSGQSPEGQYYNTQGNGLPFYQGKTEFTDKDLSAPKKWTTKTTKTANEMDIVMSVRAPVGPVNLVAEEICIGRGLAAITPKSNIDKIYLFSILKLIQDDIQGNNGAIFNSINREQIMAIPIPLPPLNIQEKIVAEIDELEQMERDRNSKIERINSKISSTLKHNTEKLISLGNAVVKTTHRITNHNILAKDYITTDTMLKNCKGVVEYQGALAEGSCIKFEENYILMSNIRPYLKKLWYATFKGGCSPDVNVFKVIDKNITHSKYIYYLLKEDAFFEYVMENVKGVKMPRGKEEHILNYKIPLLSYDVQQEIVSQIERLEKEIQLIEDELATVEERKKSILDKYLK